MSSILRGTTKIDHESSTIKTNEETGGEYREQLYYFLRNDINEELSKKLFQFIPKHDRDKNKDQIVINAYERSMKKLGLNPNTDEIIKAAQHDDNAVFLRLCGGQKTLDQFFYKPFKKITHVIKNKKDYMNLEVDCSDIVKFHHLKDGKGTVTGISKKCICITDEKGHKEFFWYITPPLSYQDCNARGLEVVEYLIDNYGE